MLVSLGQIALFQSTPSGGKATGAAGYNEMGQAMFQSTPSGGKATGGDQRRCGGVVVSIHAFRGEGDAITRPFDAAPVGFNPRLPGGRRLAVEVDGDAAGGFHQSTPSGGKAT